MSKDWQILFSSTNKELYKCIFQVLFSQLILFLSADYLLSVLPHCTLTLSVVALSKGRVGFWSQSYLWSMADASVLPLWFYLSLPLSLPPLPFTNCIYSYSQVAITQSTLACSQLFSFPHIFILFTKQQLAFLSHPLPRAASQPVWLPDLLSALLDALSPAHFYIHILAWSPIIWHLPLTVQMQSIFPCRSSLHTCRKSFI